MKDGNSIHHGDWDARREQLSAYLDGELPGADRQRLDTHLADCAACQRELAELRQVRALLHALPMPALPRSFTLPVEQPTPVPASRRTAVAARPAAPRASRWARAAQWTGGLAASIGLLLILGSALVSGGLHSSGGASGSYASNGSSAQRSTSGAPSVGSAATHPPQAGIQDHPTQSPPVLATSTPTPAANSSVGPEKAPTSVGAASPPAGTIMGLTGAALAGGGAVVFIGGSIGRRRKRHP